MEKKEERSYISFSDLMKDNLFKPEDKIKDFSNYYGHIKENSNGEVEKSEELKDHIEKVNKYFLNIIKTHNLEKVINNHIDKIKDIFEDRGKGAEFIKLLFFETINFHDIGKINPNFQAVKMKNSNFNEEENSLGTNHSILSVYLFYAYMVKKLDEIFTCDSDKGIAFVLILLFSMVIRKHHSSEITDPFYYFEYLENYEKNRFFENIKINDLIKFLGKIGIKKDENLHKNIFEGDISKNLETYYKNMFINQILDKLASFPLYSLLKLNSSLLTMADYLATASFMLGEDIPVKGIVNNDLRDKICGKFYESKNWNERLNKTDGSQKPKCFKELEDKNNENLNELRYKMLYEVRETLKDNINNNLFFLEAPTGGGKTNMSFMAVAELLNKRKDLNKVFYVFPFTTLVTQTKSSIVETFGLQDKDYIELHSRADFKDNEDNYGKEWKNFIDYQFVNYPITLLTHIRFFDIIKSNRKEDNYLYHKLANSIVIIDEIQAYSPSHWDKIYYFIKNVSELFNTVFIIMSATLPKINEIKLNSDVELTNFVHLNKNRDKYFKNPNFSKRVEFEFIDIKNDKGKKDLKVLKDKVKEKAEEYNKDNHWILVEFIYKKSASEFFKIVNKKNSGFDNYRRYLLSGTILEPVRRKIINELKENREKEGFEKVILVTTQVVEAGVDLDFDIGFKDTSIIDSDEQLAGRVNRNASKSNCKVYLFDYNEEYRVYGSDYRYKVQKQRIDFEEYKKYLLDKKFDEFYTKVFDYINELNKSELRYGFRDYEEAVKKLNFFGVHNEFKLIDQDTISVFVNVEYDLEEYPIVIDNELQNLVIEEERKIKGKRGKVKKRILKGEKVWEKYCEIIENKDIDFSKKKENIIKIQALMSNFIFSVFRASKLVNELKKYGEEKYGFLYIEDIKDIYSLENGLNEKKLSESDAWLI